jgi:uncharacterized protein (TIGR02145 family)
MKKRILVVLFALALSANLRAQVTIGELAEPAPGTILDLNKAVKGGLVLSSVDLPDFHTIPNGFPGIATQTDITTLVKTGFRGALVYNTGVKSPPAGIYVWNGTNWTPVKENCTPRTSASLTLSALPFAKAGDNVTFSVSSGAGAFCSQGESYKWYKTDAGNENYTLILDETTSSLTTPFAAVGTYKVKVEITNRYTPAPVEKETTIEITADGLPPNPLLDANYAVTGDFCYDVKGPKPASQSEGYYNSREDAFVGGAFTKTYTFTYTNDFSNLTVLNPGGIVASVSQPAVTSGTGTGSVSFTVIFVPDVQARVVANNGPIQVQLVVTYKNNSVEDKVAYKNIKIQDAVCGCPAQVPTDIHPSGWLTFQCHNLGADYDITSDADLLNITSSNFREYEGDWYKFGDKIPLENTAATPIGNINWGSAQADGEDWITANDPCPAAWRLPTTNEWRAVVDNNTFQRYANGIATTPNTSNYDWTDNSTVTNPTTDYNNGIKFGDYLYLPAAGRRFDRGQLNTRGSRGYYWSSTYGGAYAGDTFGYYMSFGGGDLGPGYHNVNYGMSVRCVAAE